MNGTAPPCSGKEAYSGRYVPAYEAEAVLHRRAALADWRFVAATRMELPG
ncbi:hypothetical protein [Lichenicoccus sp.]